MEAPLSGVPAIAFSLVARGAFDFAPAARFARQLVTAALRQPLPADLLVNVNIPGHGEPKGYAITRLGKHSYGYEVIEKEDPRGRKYYWIGGNEYQHEDIPGSDCNAGLRGGVVSLAPPPLHPPHQEMRRGGLGGGLPGVAQRAPGGAPLTPPPPPRPRLPGGGDP